MRSWCYWGPSSNSSRPMLSTILVLWLCYIAIKSQLKRHGHRHKHRVCKPRTLIVWGFSGRFWINCNQSQSPDTFILQRKQEHQPWSWRMRIFQAYFHYENQNKLYIPPLKEIGGGYSSSIQLNNKDIKYGNTPDYYKSIWYSAGLGHTIRYYCQQTAA